MVEQPIRNRQVVGSTPTLGSSIFFSLASALYDAILVCLPRLLDHDLPPSARSLRGLLSGT